VFPYPVIFVFVAITLALSQWVCAIYHLEKAQFDGKTIIDSFGSIDGIDQISLITAHIFIDIDFQSVVQNHIINDKFRRGSSL